MVIFSSCAKDLDLGKNNLQNDEWERATASAVKVPGRKFRPIRDFNPAQVDCPRYEPMGADIG
jgi:hypothetical protein